jgi:hypothetical protein
MARRDTERLRRRRVRGAAVRRHRAESRDGNRTNLFARALAGGDAVSFNVLPTEVGRGLFTSARNAGREGRRACSRVPGPNSF